MGSDIDLERRLRAHLSAERQAYAPPVQLSSSIRQAIRRGRVPHPRPALMPQLVAVLGLFLLVAGLSVGVTWIKNRGLGWSVGSPSVVTYRIATARADAYMLARMDAVLHGQANRDGTACFWLGDGSERLALIWPSGYIARGDPLAVYDGSGGLIGVVGKRVTLGGGRGAPDDGRPVSVLGCSGFTGVWAAAPSWTVSPR